MIRLIYSGQFRDPSGYGQAARDYLKALDLYISGNPGALDLRLNVIRFDRDTALSKAEDDLISRYEFRADRDKADFLKPGGHVFIGHHTPDSLRGQRDNLPLMQGAAKIINMTAWETSGIPQRWREAIKAAKVDAVIVPCLWNQDVFEAELSIPVYKLPHVIDLDAVQDADAPRCVDGVFNILAVSQWIYRKGFDALIKAYLMEFCKEEPVVLIVKSYRSNTSPEEQGIIKAEIKDIRESVYIPGGHESNAKIYFIGDLLSREDMGRLYAGCDLFALTSRGEGFGLPYTEAIARGKPILAPDAGGHVDFCDERAAYLHGGAWEPCHSAGAFYDSEMLWYEPSVASIRWQLRAAYLDWQSGKIQERGAAMRDYIKGGGYDYASIGKRFADMLKAVQRGK